MVLQLLLLALLFVLSQSTSVGGNDLKQPETRVSSNGFLQTSLTVDVFHYTDDTPIQFWTRAYEGSIPGPTLRLKPGDIMNLTLVNKLLPDISGSLNTFHSANTTNMHTHGLHVSPMGSADNSFRVVGPGETADYSYAIPDDHPWGGIFWYHPHLHGSSTLQQSGGMSGAIIIDPVDSKSIPPELAAMKEVVMVLQHLCFYNSPTDWNPYDNHLLVSQYGFDNLTINPSYLFPSANQTFYIINGQFEPVIRMTPGEFQLFRFAHAGHASSLEIVIPGCEMWIITMDGIFLTYPELYRYLVFLPATTMDVAVRCPTAGNYTVLSNKTSNIYNDYGWDANTKVWQGLLATIVVSGSPVEMTLPKSLPPLPSYMKDLRGVNDSDITERWIVALSEENGQVTPGEIPDTYYVNGESFSGDPANYQYNMTLGVIQEWTINDYTGGVNHPFHLHVNHFQIISLSGYPEWLGMKVSQWRNTIPLINGAGVVVRFIPDRWSGTLIVHCHMTPHIDMGMMATVQVVDPNSNEPPPTYPKHMH